MKSRWTILLPLFFGLTWVGAEDAWTRFQDLMPEAGIRAVPSEPVFELAKKKKNYRKNNRNGKNRNRQRNKSVKIDASSKRTIKLGGTRAAKGKQLGALSGKRLNSLGRSTDEAAWYQEEKNRLAMKRFQAGKNHENEDKAFVEKVQKRFFYGGNIDEVDSAGRTALHIAVLNGYTEATKFLVKSGADKSLKDTAGQTALSLAKLTGQHALASLLQ